MLPWQQPVTQTRVAKHEAIAIQSTPSMLSCLFTLRWASLRVNYKILHYIKVVSAQSSSSDRNQRLYRNKPAYAPPPSTGRRRDTDRLTAYHRSPDRGSSRTGRSRNMHAQLVDCCGRVTTDRCDGRCWPFRFDAVKTRPVASEHGCEHFRLRLDVQ